MLTSEHKIVDEKDDLFNVTSLLQNEIRRLQIQLDVMNDGYQKSLLEKADEKKEDV